MLNRNSTILFVTLTILDLTGFQNLSGLAYAALNDTGIKTCSNATQNGLPCPVAGFPGQDAEYGTNSFNFTKLDANGNAMPVTATNHVCVRDNVTGLIWEIKTDDGGLRDKDWTYTWYDSNSTDGNLGIPSGGSCATTGRCDTEKFVADVNATNLCGYSDWRMPDPHELINIVDYSIPYSAPAIDTDYFYDTSQNQSFWTASTLLPYDSNFGWYSWIFQNGFLGGSLPANGQPVRLVRGGQWLFSFIDQGNGTIKDNNTGLVWAKCSQGQTVAGNSCSGNATSYLTWQQALQAADTATLAGFTDWRLPNVKELQSLVDYTVWHPTISSNYFPNIPIGGYYLEEVYPYWTASALNNSEYTNDSSSSWTVSFYQGVPGIFYRNRSNDYWYYPVVRLVRDGNDIHNGLVAHYPFNGNANDESGNGNNGTVNGATLIADRFGNANSAYSFDGMSNYISVPSSTSLNPVNQLTMTFWIKILGTPNAWSAILYKGGPATDGYANREYVVWLNDTPYFHQNSAGDGAEYHWLNSPTVATENWIHYVGVVDRVNHVMQIYLNGQKVSEQSDAYSSFNTNSYELEMGGTVEGTAFFSGILDDVRLYNRALSASEIQQLYTEPSATLPLTINKTGTGNGTVTSNQPGIDCGADCTESYNYGTSVTLTATPATDSNFGGWTGDADCSDGTVTMDVAKNCIATFTLKTYTVTPSANPAAGGTYTPTGIQTVNHGATQIFTVTPKTGYTKSNTVSGTCPETGWNGNVWTTGAITTNCTVILNFTPIITAPTCTSNAATNVTVNSATLNGNVVSSSATATASFELGPTSIYGTNLAAVPSQIYSSTPVAISATTTGLACKTTYHYRCKATNSAGTGYGGDKSFTTLATCPANAWLYPTNPAVVVGKPLALDIHVNSNSNAVGAYDFTVNFDPTKLLVDTAYQNAACIQGVCPGSAALASNNVLTDNATGKIRLSGFDTTGVGSGNDLQLLVMHFIAKNVTGLTPVGLITNALTNPQGMPLGGVATGTTVKVSPGLCGDSDGNYNVNIVDALSISRYVVGYPPPPTITVNLADVNRDAAATIVDALHIARFSVGLVVTGTCAIGQPL